MRCTEWRWPVGVLGSGLLGVLCGCSQPAPPAAGPAAQGAGPAAAPSARAPEPPPARPGERGPALPLPPPRPVANWDEVRRQAAQRIVAANPEGTYLGTVPEALLAIPVLEVELKRDGSVARVIVLRAPRQAKDTSVLAIAAVHRAAPFGDVSRLPRPWRFTETFLFNDERKFKPRTLDE